MTQKQDTTLQQNLQYQQKTDFAIKELHTQIGQLATDMNQLNPLNFQSQPLVNPIEHVNAVMLRSEKQLEPNQQRQIAGDLDQEEEVKTEPRKKSIPFRKSKVSVPTHNTPPPFLSRFSKSKKQDQDKEILDIFSKLEISIPLIEDIRTVPRFTRALPDSGAFINVMPALIHDSLNLGPLKETRLVLQLAERSNVYPKGVVENILVQVNELIFPVYFYVLEISDANSSKSTPLLVGRPFMSTAGMKINVQQGTLTMEFDGEVVCFSIFKDTRYASDVNSCVLADVVEVYEKAGV
ncbi:uncharacterized protein LOC113305857 [Papaver somniferum]|uniref:uncharacterized protein LOC113305857 n=1 Tax=Papaver somniferum TaxID=3469 RepID=UPI000E6F8F4D|nr:uncharacterized protein LOC113305857 [Papaver somniferum]